MSSVFIDTAPLIYLIEGTASRREVVRRRLANWIDSGVSLRSSVLVLTELLVPLKRDGNTTLVHQYKSTLCDLLGGPLLPIDAEQAEWAAELRARYGFRTPDALQLAGALALGCDVFFSNDRALRRCTELNVVLVDE